LEDKIVQSIDRIARAYRMLLWNFSKKYKLTPLQSQILLYIFNNPYEKIRIKTLTKEFGITQPTVSDSVKTLIRKGLILQEKDGEDKRETLLKITFKGKGLAEELMKWMEPFKDTLKEFEEEDRSNLLFLLLNYIALLQKKGIISVAKICLTCIYFSNYHCKLLNIPLTKKDLRINCPDYLPNLL